MATIPQYYGGTGAPLVVAGDPQDVAAAWASHRARLRGWLARLPNSRWNEPTRCDDWDIADLVRHLATGATFAGYTLHAAQKGEATRILEGFDAQSTPGQVMALLASAGPDALRAALAEADARIGAEVAGYDVDAWQRTAEAPPGHVPAHLSLSHFVFDSWVHERDALLPAGETPPVDPAEVAVVARYLFGLVGVIARDRGVRSMRVRLVDAGVTVAVTDDGAAVRTEVDAGDRGAAGAVVVEGPAGAVIDRATGRAAEGVEGDPAALGVLDHFATHLA